MKHKIITLLTIACAPSTFGMGSSSSAGDGKAAENGISSVASKAEAQYDAKAPESMHITVAAEGKPSPFRPAASLIPMRCLASACAVARGERPFTQNMALTMLMEEKGSDEKKKAAILAQVEEFHNAVTKISQQLATETTQSSDFTTILNQIEPPFYKLLEAFSGWQLYTNLYSNFKVYLRTNREEMASRIPFVQCLGTNVAPSSAIESVLAHLERVLAYATNMAEEECLQQ
jgi:hypothetical protein